MKMKKKALDMLSAVTAIVKARSVAVKSKANAMKTRLIILWLLRNKSFLASAISVKIHALLNSMSHGREKGGDHHDIYKCDKAIASSSSSSHDDAAKQDADHCRELDEDGDQYLQQQQQEEEVTTVELMMMFDSDDAINGKGSSDYIEIDDMADEFIRRFHQQMRMEKQDDSS